VLLYVFKFLPYIIVFIIFRWRRNTWIGSAINELFINVFTLTTVGYGDVYATSDLGQFITMISSTLGIAIVALPSGIIIAGYQEELQEIKDKNGIGHIGIYIQHRNEVNKEQAGING